MRFDEVAKAALAIDAYEKAEANLRIAYTMHGAWTFEFTDKQTLDITHDEMIWLLLARRDRARETLINLGVQMPGTGVAALVGEQREVAA